jgi:hypothetical protein
MIIYLRIARFRRLNIPWAKLTSDDVSGDFAVFVMTEGRSHKVRLNLLHNADEVREGISTHAQTAGYISQGVSGHFERVEGKEVTSAPPA